MQRTDAQHLVPAALPHEGDTVSARGHQRGGLRCSVAADFAARATRAAAARAASGVGHFFAVRAAGSQELGVIYHGWKCGVVTGVCSTFARS